MKGTTRRPLDVAETAEAVFWFDRIQAYRGEAEVLLAAVRHAQRRFDAGDDAKEILTELRAVLEAPSGPTN